MLVSVGQHDIVVTNLVETGVVLDDMVNFLQVLLGKDPLMPLRGPGIGFDFEVTEQFAENVDRKDAVPDALFLADPGLYPEADEVRFFRGVRQSQAREAKGAFIDLGCRLQQDAVFPGFAGANPHAHILGRRFPLVRVVRQRESQVLWFVLVFHPGPGREVLFLPVKLNPPPLAFSRGFRFHLILHRDWSRSGREGGIDSPAGTFDIFTNLRRGKLLNFADMVEAMVGDIGPHPTGGVFHYAEEFANGVAILCPAESA